MMPRDHQRAQLAFNHVSTYSDASDRETQKYGSMVLKLPVLIHTEGLAAALHFVAARSHPHQRIILDHLAVQLELDGATALLAQTRAADLARTRWLTREIQRCLGWYKTFVRSELRVDPTADDARQEAD